MYTIGFAQRQQLVIKPRQEERDTGCRNSRNTSKFAGRQSSERYLAVELPEVEDSMAPQIPKKLFGRTGKQVSVVGMGCSPFGHAYGVRPLIRPFEFIWHAALLAVFVQ